MLKVVNYHLVDTEVLYRIIFFSRKFGVLKFQMAFAGTVLIVANLESNMFRGRLDKVAELICKLVAQ